jgi:hypothetical protein
MYARINRRLHLAITTARAGVSVSSLYKLPSPLTSHDRNTQELACQASFLWFQCVSCPVSARRLRAAELRTNMSICVPLFFAAIL